MDRFIVKKIIDNWDAIDLLTHAPKDEYDGETTKIMSQANENMNENELGTVIFNVFTKAFGANTFNKSINECVVIAKQIIEEHKR